MENKYAVADEVPLEAKVEDDGDENPRPKRLKTASFDKDDNDSDESINDAKEWKKYKTKQDDEESYDGPEPQW